jgi:trans-aconitate methyltransferase
MSFLRLGASVTAIDISEIQLDRLRQLAGTFAGQLETRCQDVQEALASSAEYHVIVANSLLHHIPDYVMLIRKIAAALSPRAQLLTFQDPIRFQTLPRATLLFDRAAYFSWRVRQGDVVAGLQRRLRRARGIYLENSVEDNTEFHNVREGVDHNAVLEELSGAGLECQLIEYFSTQSPTFQHLGQRIGVQNTFAIVARRPG